MFPFIYGGKKFTWCSKGWCSLTPVYRGKWGRCKKNCKAIVSLCKCDTPRKGTNGHNRFTCNNGVRRSCAVNQECYAKGSFIYGYWNQGCRKPPPVYCKCDTPRKGTSGHNRFSCTNGIRRYCSKDKECFIKGRFQYGHWNKVCRKPPGFNLPTAYSLVLTAVLVICA